MFSEWKDHQGYVIFSFNVQVCKAEVHVVGEGKGSLLNEKKICDGGAR